MPIKEAIAALKKEIKNAQLLDLEENVTAITTGSIAVDFITGIGGFPRGRLSEVFGWESSGKTTLCLSACANAQRKGMLAAYIDMERAVSLSWATEIGFDYRDDNKGVYMTPANFEECSHAVEQLALADVDLIIVDSVPAMVPKSMMEGDIDDQGAIGLGSRMMAKFLSRITKTIYERNIALVMINQMRAKINTAMGSQWEPKEQSAGGSALKFYGSLRIDMEQVKKIEENEKSLFTGRDVKVTKASLHRAKAFKNKVATPYRTCEFYIKFGADGISGVDNLQTIIEFAKNKGIIQSSGAGYFAYTSAAGVEGHNFSLRGTDELYRHVANNPELKKEIRAAAGL